MTDSHAKKFTSHSNIPVACLRVTSRDQYTHAIVLTDGDKSRNCFGCTLQMGRPSRFYFTNMVERLHSITGDDFFLNEFPHAADQPLGHRLFLDIDIPNFSDFEIECVKQQLDDFVPGATVLVARNEESGKIHLVTNLWIGSERQKPITRFLQSFILEGLVDTDEATWNAGYDAGASGIRSVFSIKRCAGPIISRARYLPQPFPAADANFAEVLWQYSIYNCENTISVPAARLLEVEDAEVDRLSRRDNITAEEKLINETNMITVFGREFAIDAGFIDRVLGCIGDKYKAKRAWWVVFTALRSATQNTEYDPTYFLTDWSEGGEGFNAADNRKRWDSYKPVPDKAGRGVQTLLDMAKRTSYSVLKNALVLADIFNPDNKTYFCHFKDVPQCPKADRNNSKRYFEAIRAFIRKTIAHISNGGKSLWVTRNLLNGEIDYQMIKCSGHDVANFNAIHFIVDWAPPDAKKPPTYLEQLEKAVVIADRPVDAAEDKKEDALEPVITTLLRQMTLMLREITYTRRDFMPFVASKPWANPEQAFNTFTQLASDHKYEARKPAEYEAELAPILRHLREVLCAGDDPSYQFMLRWLAHCVQKPAVKVGTAIVIQSHEGTGKTIFWDWFGNHVIGERYYLPTTMDRVVSKFNALACGKLLTVFEETRSGEGAKCHEQLKVMITDGKQTIEPKNVDAYTIPSFSNIVILTNDLYPVKLTVNDRRFFCLAANNALKHDTNYWATLLPCFHKRGKKLGLLMFEYLWGFDLKGWKADPIATPLRRELKMDSLESPVRFLVALALDNFEDMFVNNKLAAHTAKLFAAYERWRALNGIKFGTTASSFGKQISVVHPSTRLSIAGNQAQGHSMTRDELIACLRVHMNEPTFGVEEPVVEVLEDNVAELDI